MPSPSSILLPLSNLGDGALVTVIPFSEKVAARFGTESARLRRLGQPLPDFDLVIAATALQHGLTLLTEDRHFERFPSLVIQSLYGTGR